jgi:hypothetical protein
LGHPIESSPALSSPFEATPNELSTALSRFGGQPQWIADGFISAWWGNPLELSTALFRFGGATPMDRRWLYIGLVGNPHSELPQRGQRIPAQGATLGKIVDKSGAF